MAKIAFSKLNAKVNTDVKTIIICEDKEIEVRQYLPVSEKLSLIGDVIQYSYDVDNNFANPLKTEVYLIINLLMYYTNINFTDKQKDDPAKLYDMLISSDWLSTVMDNIPEEEINVIRDNLTKTQNAFYSYRTSLLGVLESASTEYEDLDLDITELQRKLANGENIELVKKIVDKLG